ncbi:MAG: conserved rane protein of unknown function [Parcubacteria group bacterium]|nr:conserved rane protein of unknown function [Parcubacteria group bacterium]
MIEQYSQFFKNHSLKRSLVMGILLLLASLVVNFYAGVYATERASNPVTDIILSNVPVYDLDEIFVYGSWILVAFIAYVCVKNLRKTPFTLKTIALFVLVRALFITLTHLGPFPHAAVINPASFIRYFVFGGDLFFSGHTGLPFLLALVFWKDRRLRMIFLCTSIFFAVVVLLAHLHYTIDVLSAFFISYGIFHMAEVLFKKDLEFFNSSLLE